MMTQGAGVMGDVTDRRVWQDNGSGRIGSTGGERASFCFVIEHAVANVFGVAPEALAAPNRGQAKIAFCRQVAMYLAHVYLGMNLTQTGQIFRRDRTTVAHACEHIENLRDDPRFDQALGALERAFHAAEGFVLKTGGNAWDRGAAK